MGLRLSARVWSATPLKHNPRLIMQTTMRTLPALTNLVVFECAARSKSFKEAANSLGVTPGAVSHQIKALEQALGIRLFIRQHRSVQLTAQGLVLYNCVDKSFTEINAAIRQICKESSNASVTVGATSAVSSLWLSPAIKRFWRQHQNLSVNQLVSDTRFSGQEPPDLFICYGRDPRFGMKHHTLYRDKLVPVCAPQLAAQLGSLSLEQLSQQRLIHLDNQKTNGTNWQCWFQSFDHDYEPTDNLRINNYSMALDLAEDGAGIVLGLQRLIQPRLAQKSLVRLTDFSMDAPHSFHLISRPEEQLSSNAILLRDWLIDNL